MNIFYTLEGTEEKVHWISISLPHNLFDLFFLTNAYFKFIYFSKMIFIFILHV